MYKVLKPFDDLMDVRASSKEGNLYQHYEAGDDYPRKGYNPSQERILELGTAMNRQGAPLIEIQIVEVEEEKPKKKRTTKKKKAEK